MIASLNGWFERGSQGRWLRSFALALCLTACGASQSEPEWPPLAKKWFDRANASYHQGDMDDAQLAVENAIRVDSKRPEVRLLAAQVALSRLEFDRAVQLTEGMTSADAGAVRGRALWYAGRVSEAADVLETLTADPEVHDSWAVDIAKVARRGIGRKPFSISGGLLAVSEMPRVGRSLLVPLELDGEPALALVATGVSETVVDATAGSEPKWVSLRFGERVEVRDVPALTKDLSTYSRQLNAPIKVLLGVNLLRRLRPTFDVLGEQFVVRSFDPPPPPAATLVPVSYLRGGGIMVKGLFGSQESGTSGALLIDTALDFPLALDEGGWQKAGKKVKELAPVPGQRGLAQGIVPMLTLGALSIPEIPALSGIPLAEIEKPTGVDLAGIIGAGLLAPFRVTMVDGGRTLWLEPMPMQWTGEEPGPESSEPAPTGQQSPAAPAPPAPAAAPPSAPRSPASNAPR